MSTDEFAMISKNNMLSPLASGKEIELANQSFTKHDPS